MPRDSNQVYTLPEAPFQNNTTALPGPVNNNFSDIAGALTASLTRGETTAYTRTLLDDADATTARGTLGVAAVPTATPGVVGQWTQVGSATGGNLVLPSGGTWAYLFFNFTNANAFTGTVIAGVNAGGTTLVAGVANFYWTGLAWRIA